MSENSKLRPLALTPFTSRELKPSGWLKQQLRIQAEGLCGNLDKLWSDIHDGRWVGGSKDSWEKLPYWLDGFIPMAWLLDDHDLQKRALFYIDHIIAGQKADGWLPPVDDKERYDYDLWAFFLICKALVVYADCSGDGERIEKVITSALHCIASHINGHTIFNWAAARWFECLIPIFWLYERIGGEWLLDLAWKLEAQGIDWEKIFTHYIDEKPMRKWTYLTHVVNIAMCLKSGALMSRYKGGDTDAFARLAAEKLFKYHGTAVGHFTGDECVAGTSPVQGTELCGVVEAMYSYETLLAVGGNPEWADNLEVLAFNALPATISPDMKTHQYDQMVNQVQCDTLPADHNVFMTNPPDSHIFGWGPHSGCCTPNFGQGWSKFALSAFMKSSDGIASVLPVPSELNCEIKGKKVRCVLETGYPFRDTLRYTVEADEPISFSLSIRIPGRVKSATVDGKAAKPGAFFDLKREWKGKTVIDVSFVLEPELEKRPNNRYCLRRGNLVFSIAPKERWEKKEYIRAGVEMKFPYCEFEVYAESPWNYAFPEALLKTTEKAKIVEKPISDIPFSPDKPPLALRTAMTPIEWGLVNGVCEAYPSGKTSGTPIEVDLIPYGCTNLRITEMPVAIK